jgi:hypothetical protein
MMSEEYVPDIKSTQDMINDAAELKEVNKQPTHNDSRQKYIDEYKTKIRSTDMSMFPKPNPNCKYCYGRGVAGWDTFTKESRLCRCILNKMGKKNVEYLTLGELKSILNYSKKFILKGDNDDETNSKDV